MNLCLPVPQHSCQGSLATHTNPNPKPKAKLPPDNSLCIHHLLQHTAVNAAAPACHNVGLLLLQCCYCLRVMLQLLEHVVECAAAGVVPGKQQYQQIVCQLAGCQPGAANRDGAGVESRVQRYMRGGSAWYEKGRGRVQGERIEGRGRHLLAHPHKATETETKTKEECDTLKQPAFTSSTCGTKTNTSWTNTQCAQHTDTYNHLLAMGQAGRIPSRWGGNLQSSYSSALAVSACLLPCSSVAASSFPSTPGVLCPAAAACRAWSTSPCSQEINPRRATCTSSHKPHRELLPNHLHVARLLCHTQVTSEWEKREKTRACTHARTHACSTLDSNGCGVFMSMPMPRLGALDKFDHSP